MALDEAEQAQIESGRRGTAAWLILLGPVVFGTLFAGAVLFFGLGFSFAFTQGDSMEPNYQSGSLVIEREVDPTSLRVGDVISFYAPWAQVHVMHRIVGINTRGGQLWFRTRGDNNPVADPAEVTFEDEKPQKIVLAFPGGLEAAFAIAAVVLGLLAIKAVGDLFNEDGY